MNFYVFDTHIELQGAITSYDYLSWTRNFFEPLNMEIQLKFDKDLLEILKVDNYIYKKDTDEFAVIDTIQIVDEESQLVRVTGRGLSSFFDRRVCKFSNAIDKDKETYTAIDIGNLFYVLVDENCINPEDANRKIPNMVMEQLQTDQIVNELVDINNRNMLEAMKDYATKYQVGYRIDLDMYSKQFKVETLVPRDNTENVIFSKNYGNIINQTYMYSKKDYKNVSIDSDGKVTGDAKGLERREMVGDNLEDYMIIDTLETTPNQNSYPEYLVDYDLGDIVTTKNNLIGITQRQLITKIQEDYSESGKQLAITLGIPVPSLMEKIKRDIRKG